MNHLFKSVFTLIFITNFYSCYAQLTFPQGGGSKKATVSERIGITDVTISYDRPGVKGREGKIWGTSVAHYGYKDLGFGTSKGAPWRAGANENTTISFSTDVKVEGKNLSSGTYGFFIGLEEGSATIIFSNNSTSWGSYFYNSSEDALRVNVKTQKTNESVERLKYEFFDETDSSAVIALLWEKLKIPFQVEVDYLNTQLASFRKELRSQKGFTADAFQQAAAFCLQHNTNLKEALDWSETSISGIFIGQKNFANLSTKASILSRLGKTAEADAIMKEALPLGTITDVHQFGRLLISSKKYNEALAIFQMNEKKYPNQFTTNAGLARGYSAVGDFKTALKYATKALPQAPDANNKASVENMIKLLNEKKDINQ